MKSDGEMNKHEKMVLRLVCVAAVACVIFQIGPVVYPAIAAFVGESSFIAVEAVAAATLGFGLFDRLFG